MDDIFENLKRKGIEAKKYFYPAVHVQRAYGDYRSKYQGTLPVTGNASQEGLASSLFSHTSDAVVIRGRETIKEVL